MTIFLFRPSLPRYFQTPVRGLFWSSQTRSMSRSHLPERLEEQRLPKYSSRKYYPMRIGEILNDRYQIVTKLGFGAYSTVWLARDQRFTERYSTIKVCVQDDADASPIRNEIETLNHLAQCPQVHPGSKYARTADDIFDVQGPSGSHSCLVLRPQGCSLWTLQNMFAEGKVPVEIVKYIVQRLLGCINWLFCDCDVVHTEITAQNVLMGLNDGLSLQRIEEAEEENRSESVFDGDYPVYPSRGQPTSMLELSCDPVLTDFGSARSATVVNDDWWMPDTHRAPEVLMSVPWDAQVDVWSIGIMALELLEGKNLFSPIDKVHNQYVLPLALAQYMSYMGPPPLWMIQKSSNPAIKSFFNEAGDWTAEPNTSEAALEDFVTSIPSKDEKAKFLAFMRKILVWDPAERGQSANLFSDEWLMGP